MMLYHVNCSAGGNPIGTYGPVGAFASVRCSAGWQAAIDVSPDPEDDTDTIDCLSLLITIDGIQRIILFKISDDGKMIEEQDTGFQEIQDNEDREYHETT